MSVLMTAPAWSIDTTGTGSSGKLGAPAQNKEATDLPSSFFKTGLYPQCATCHGRATHDRIFKFSAPCSLVLILTAWWAWVTIIVKELLRTFGGLVITCAHVFR
jgi:hypothetical protein